MHLKPQWKYQRITEIPDGFTFKNFITHFEIQKSHEAQSVGNLKFGLVI